MKAGLLATTYLSISWVLTVSYQLFTETAVKSVAGYLTLSWSDASSWLNSNVQVLVFVYAFTWIFVLSSVIPSVILGKKRGVLIHYIFVLTLTLIAFFIADILQTAAGIQLQDIFTIGGILNNPLLAGIYLSIPYLLMLFIDYRSRIKDKKSPPLKQSI